jgi:hypothetical protein
MFKEAQTIFSESRRLDGCGLWSKQYKIPDKLKPLKVVARSPRPAYRVGEYIRN